ncbi:MAG: hypothetical protein AB7L92_02910 [Alphaproteobacteria bacterium]
MSRYKKIKDFPDDLDTLSMPELMRWLDYWQTKKKYLGTLPAKSVEKTIHSIEKAISRKQSEAL